MHADDQRQRRKRTGMQVTDNIINKIMLCTWIPKQLMADELKIPVVTIQTGFVTAVFAIADVVLALTLRVRS